jgi:hypothetical protein
MADVLPAAEGGEEGDFLRQVLFDSVPDRVRGVVYERRGVDALQLVTLCLLTATVGAGFVFAVIQRWRAADSQEQHT